MILIQKSLFLPTRLNIKRYVGLLSAFNTGIILAHNIFLSYEIKESKNSNCKNMSMEMYNQSMMHVSNLMNSAVFIYTVEYCCLNEIKNECVLLSDLLQNENEEELNYIQKLMLFRNILSAVRALHDLGLILS